MTTARRRLPVVRGECFQRLRLPIESCDVVRGLPLAAGRQAEPLRQGDDAGTRDAFR
ncbi:MAG: hypothetical protein QOI08_3511, partial [Actinomycetota bacterium]|nr:hypothetical protein [Actinomycetota bacterium]